MELTLDQIEMLLVCIRASKALLMIHNKETYDLEDLSELLAVEKGKMTRPEALGEIIMSKR